EVLNGTRNLTLPMIRRLHVQFGIPLESLVGV
ncbi:TPA: transcriptional regulator, partial [Escherichia coli]